MEDNMTAFSKTTIRSLLGAAAFAGLVLTLAAPASAGLVDNGIEVNGIEVNGLVDNGININGLVDNGTQVNGLVDNGVHANGVAPKGTSAVTQQDGAFDFGSVTLIGVTPPRAAVR
jgi:hypothetical protein